MEAKTISTLNWLLEKYLENPNGVWDISESLQAQEVELDPSEVGDYLVKRGFARYADDLEAGLKCKITTLGMLQVSDVLNEAKFRILEAAIEQKKSSVMEIMGFEPGDYKKAIDYSTYLKRMGIIECIFHPHDVFARPTFYGREWYEANKQRSIN